MMDRDEMLDDMRDGGEYDDDVACGEFVISAIADVATDEEVDPCTKDDEIMRRIDCYIDDVVIQSLKDYVHSHREDIITNVRYYMEERDEE